MNSSTSKSDGGSGGGGGGSSDSGICDCDGCSNPATYNYYTQTPVRCAIHKDTLAPYSGTFAAERLDIIIRARQDGNICECKKTDCSYYSGEPCVGKYETTEKFKYNCIGWGHGGSLKTELRPLGSMKHNHFRCSSCISQYISEEGMRQTPSPATLARNPGGYLHDKPLKGTPSGDFIKTTMLGMDEYNKKAATIMLEKGSKAAEKYMFQHPTEKRSMSYSEMRSLYG